MIVAHAGSTEDDEYRARRLKSQRHHRASVQFVPYRCLGDATGFGIPKFRHFSANAEDALRRIKFPPLVRDEINVRRAGDAMDIGQLRVGGLAGEFKIWFQILGGENIRQRFAPDHAALTNGVFQNIFAIAIAPNFGGQIFHLRVGLRIIGKARRMFRARPDNRCASTH